MPTDAKIVACFLLMGFGLLMVGWGLLSPSDPDRKYLIELGVMLASGSGSAVVGSSIVMSRLK